jgi:ribonucleoside-diphosphate reductase alpha chain
MMDCDTTGIEPDFALVKHKNLVGGGSMAIVNQTVPRALRNLGYNKEQTDAIVDHISENGSVTAAPFLKPEHERVFACAVGDNAIHYLGHVRMMAAVQPFLSGALSKTVNMPESSTVEEIEQLHIEAWKLGLKAIAIYRDNCKVAQPLSGKKKLVEAESISEAKASLLTRFYGCAHYGKSLDKSFPLVIRIHNAPSATICKLNRLHFADITLVTADRIRASCGESCPQTQSIIR